jgi:hypothetical protein
VCKSQVSLTARDTPLTTWVMKAGPLSDPMLLDTLNQGIISLASTLDTSVAFSMRVGYAFTLL